MCVCFDAKKERKRIFERLCLFISNRALRLLSCMALAQHKFICIVCGKESAIHTAQSSMLRAQCIRCHSIFCAAYYMAALCVRFFLFVILLVPILYTIVMPLDAHSFIIAFIRVHVISSFSPCSSHDVCVCCVFNICAHLTEIFHRIVIC